MTKNDMYFRFSAEGRQLLDFLSDCPVFTKLEIVLRRTQILKMQGGYGGGKPAPAPIFNHRKRPRQAMFADPTSPSESPPTDRGPDLMPVGGFLGNNRPGQYRPQGQKRAYSAQQTYQNQGMTDQPPQNRPGNLNNAKTGGNPGNWGQQTQMRNNSSTDYGNSRNGNQRGISSHTTTNPSQTQGYQQSSTFTSRGQQYNNTRFPNQQNNQSNVPQNYRQQDNQSNLSSNYRQQNNQSNVSSNYRQQNNQSNVPPNYRQQDNQSNVSSNYRQQNNQSNVPPNYQQQNNRLQQGVGYGNMTGGNKATVGYGNTQNQPHNHGKRAQPNNTPENRNNRQANSVQHNYTGSGFGSKSQYSRASIMDDQLPAAPGSMFNQAAYGGRDDVQSFDQTSGRDTATRNNKPQQKKLAQKNPEKPSLRLLTANLDTVLKSAVVSEQLGPHMFEVFGVLDTAVVSDKSGTGREFVLRDETASLNCVFYEIDRNLPRLIRGQWQRCVGSLDARSGKLKCVSVRAVQGEERQRAREGQRHTQQVLAGVGTMAHEQ